MTDNEIIKALEWLKEVMGVCSSDDEYIYGKIILDLINRQQVDIERLQKENNQFADIGKMYSEIKSDAIKEFAERLKEHKHECGCNYRKKPVYAVTEEKLDNLVKEMVGDDK